MINHDKRLVLKHPIITIFFMLLIVLVAAMGLKDAKIISDFEVFFGETNPELKAYHALQDTYSKSDNVFFIVTPHNKQVFSKEAMLAVEYITEQSWFLPYANRVNSLTNYQHTQADEDDLLVGDLIENVQDATPKDFARAQQIALSEPTLVNRLIRVKSDVTGVNVTVQLPGEELHKEIPLVVVAARALKIEIEKKYPVDIRITGRIMNKTAFREFAIQDLKTLVPFALLLALICIAAYIYSASGSLVTMISATSSVIIIIFAAILTALGLGIWFGIDISPPVANAPTIILTLAIADSIHILVSFFQQMRLGNSRFDAMKESLRLNAQPVFITSVTTVVGFLSLNFSDSPPFHDLGNVVAMGVVAAWLFSIVLLPALMMIMPLNIYKSQEKDTSAAMSKIANWVINKRIAILVSSVVIITVSLAFLPQNRINDVWAEYFQEGTWPRDNGDYMREHLTSTNTLEFNLSSGIEGGVSEPEYLQTIEDFAQWLRTQSRVMHVFTFSDIMKRLNKNMHADKEEWYRLPKERNLAAQYLLLYELSLPYGLDTANQVNMDKSATRLIVTLKSSATDDVLALQSDSMNWLKNNAPEAMFDRGASSDIMFAHIGARNVRSMLLGSIAALLVISIILMVALKSVRFGLLSLIPNLIPAAVAFGIWGAFVGEIGLSLSIVAGMTLGIVVDYTVHFLSKYLRAQRENNLNTKDSIHYAFNTVGVALLVTTIILVANFSVLAMSSFALNADMGIMTAMTIVIALVVDFLLLPAIILTLWKDKPEPSGNM
jgi:predicted RND superfamily exporter protein